MLMTSDRVVIFKSSVAGNMCRRVQGSALPGSYEYGYEKFIVVGTGSSPTGSPSRTV